MIGLLIITHERFGFACESLSRHFFNYGDNPVRHLMVQKNDDPDELILKAQELRDSVDQGHGVLILNDIFGATPFNVAKKLVDERTALLTGANAPMIVRAISYAPKSQNLSEFVTCVKEAGIEGIIDLTADNLKQYD